MKIEEDEMNEDAKMIEDPFEAMHAVSELRHRTVDVDIDDGMIVTLRSLGAKDETDTFVECMNFWGQAFLYKHKIETLARSITAINGNYFQISDDEKKDMIDAKKEILGSWHQDIIDELYSEYAGLTGRIDEYLEKMAVSAETNAAGYKDAKEKRELLNVDSNKLDEEKTDEEQEK